MFLKSPLLLFLCLLAFSGIREALAQSDDVASTTSIEGESQLALKNSLSDEQIAAIKKLTESHRIFDLTSKRQIGILKQKMAAAFLDPTVKSETILALQEQLDSVQNELDRETVRSAIGIRKILSPAQREVLVYGDPEVNFAGTELTSAQWDAYKVLMQEFLKTKLLLERKIAELEFDRKLLYQNINLDEAALLAKQDEINKTKAAIETAKVKLACDSRSVLSKDQRLKIFNRHHPKIWQDTGINPKQDDAIMGIHMKIEAADQEGRRGLILLKNDLASLYTQPLPDETQALKITDQIDKQLSDTYKKQISYLFEGRSQLTPGQREKLVGLMKAPVAPSPASHLLDPDENPSLRAAPDGFAEFITDYASVKYLPSAKVFVREPNEIVFSSGKALICTESKTIVKAGTSDIVLEPHVIVVLKANRFGLIIQNLCDTKLHSVFISNHGQKLEVNAGTELMISPSDEALAKLKREENVGRRRLSKSRFGKLIAQHADISIITILQNDTLIHKIVKRNGKSDKDIIDRSMHMAAALQQATQSKGPYSSAGK